MNAIEYRRKAAQAWEQMKAIHDAAEGRGMTAEEEQAWNRADSEYVAMTQRAEQAEKMERTPVQEVEARNEALAPEQRAAVTVSSDEYRAAARNWLRYGTAGLSEEERSIVKVGRVSPAEARALGTNVGTGAGMLVAPLGFAGQIEQAMLFYGGMRAASTVVSTANGADLPWPTSNDTSNTGAIFNENPSSQSEQDVTVGQVIFKAHMYTSKMVRVSTAFLQDAAVDVEAWLAGLLGERLGRITNTHFTVGAGPNNPTGITQDSVLGVTAASATAITADELIDLEYSVDVAYRRQGCGWMMHDSTAKLLRKLKDGDGQYLWAPAMVSGQPATLNSYPIYINNDMPTAATGNKSLLFGQFSKYMIRDVQGMNLLRLDERYAELGQVAFLAFSRHDGKLLDAGGNPVKHLVQA